MVEVQIDTGEIVAVMQEMFPKEYTICVQKLHITKLEERIEQHQHSNGDASP